MRALVIVIVPPSFERAPGVRQAAEPMVFKHCSRSRALKLSMKPFCCGWPGSMKSCRIFCSRLQDANRREVNSGPLSDSIDSGRPRSPGTRGCSRRSAQRPGRASCRPASRGGNPSTNVDGRARRRPAAASLGAVVGALGGASSAAPSGTADGRAGGSPTSLRVAAAPPAGAAVDATHLHPGADEAHSASCRAAVGAARRLDVR